MSKHKKKKAQLEKLELEILKWTAIGSGLQLTDDFIKMINKLLNKRQASQTTGLRSCLFVQLKFNMKKLESKRSKLIALIGALVALDLIVRLVTKFL